MSMHVHACAALPGTTSHTKDKLGRPCWRGQEGTWPMGAAHPTPPACLCTSAPSPCPSPDTGVCAVPGVQGGGPPARSDGGPCLESRRLLLVTSSTVSTATLKAYSCCLANEPALAAVLGDTEPRPPAHHPDLGPQQPLPPPMNPQITSPRQCLDSPAAPPSAPRPPKATDPLHPAGRAPRPTPAPAQAGMRSWQ